MPPLRIPEHDLQGAHNLPSPQASACRTHCSRITVLICRHAKRHLREGALLLPERGIVIAPKGLRGPGASRGTTRHIDLPRSEAWLCSG